MKKFLLKSKFVLSLLTWQTSLIVAAVAALILSGILVVATPEAQEDSDKVVVQKVSKANYSERIIIKFDQSLEDINVFVYDQLATEKGKPINLDIKESENGDWFELFPGAYKIVLFKDGYESLERDIVLNTGQERLLFKLDFEELEEGEVPDSSLNGPIEIPEITRPPVSAPIYWN